MTIARTVGRNTLSTAVLRFASLGVWFVVTPRVLHALGAERFGFWSILLAFGGSLATLDLGLGVAVTRAVARLRDEGGPGALPSVLRRAALLQAGLAAALGVGIVLCAGGILRLFNVPAAWQGEARTALYLSVSAFVLTTLGNLFLAGLQGLQRMDHVVPFAVPAALGLGAAVWWATRRPEPLVVLTAVQLGYAAVVALAYGGLLVRLALREAAEAGAPGAGGPAPRGHMPLRELLRVGGWVQASTVIAFLHLQADKFLLGALVALAPVASYELGMRVTSAALIAPMIFLGSLLPEFSRATVDGARVPLGPLYLAALDPHLALTFGIAGALIPLAPWILAAWLGTPPPGAVMCLVALTVSSAGAMFTGIATTVVRARGDLRLELAYGLLSGGLHVTLSLLGLRLAGLPGLLAGLVVSSLVSGLWYVRRVDRTLDRAVQGQVGRHAWPFLASAALAAGLAFAAAAGLARTAPGPRGIVALVGGGAAYALGYAAVLRLGFHATWATLVERGRRLHAGAA